MFPKHTRRLGVIALPILAAALLAACGDDEGDGATVTTTARAGTATATPRAATATATVKAATATATPKAAATGAANQLTASVEGMGGNNIDGTVTVTPDGNNSRVQVQLTGVPAGNHANHFHTGSCANQGPVHEPLEQVDVPSSGGVNETTTLQNVGVDHLGTGHYYAIHVGDDDNPGAVIACGDLR